MSELLTSNLVNATIAGLAVAVAAGFLGSFMVMRRMTLVSDALSHVALPGLALALTLKINPFLGAFAFLLLAAFVIAGVERRTALPTDAIVGVLFSSSLALGILLTPEPELLEALFGEITAIGDTEMFVTVVASLLVVGITVLLSRRLMLSIVASDLGQLSQRRARLTELFFLMMVAMTVALGVKFVGTLLMGTLTIIPAAAAKNVARSLFGFGIVSMIFAAVSVLIGMGAVYFFEINAGAGVILASAAIFLVTLFFRQSA